MIAEAIVGADFKIVRINGKFYKIEPPTIHRLAGCIKCLAGMKQGETIKDALETLGDLGKYAAALSWLVAGDETMAKEFEQGKPKEVVDAVETGLSLIDVEVFQKAVILSKYVARIAASTK